MPNTFARSRARSATVRFVCLVLIAAMFTSGLALPALFFAPARYRRIHRIVSTRTTLAQRSLALRSSGGAAF